MENEQNEQNEATDIRSAAINYQPKVTKNIADLESVNVNEPILKRKGTDKDDTHFTYYVIVRDDEDYRIPNSVLAELQTQLEEKPDAVSFKVKRKGTGINTTYSVVILD